MRQSSTAERETGFTLVEVLIAMLILTLGVGGIIVMQLHALRMVQESGFQANATQLAAELAELMRNATPDAYLFSHQGTSDNTGASLTYPDCYRHACDPVAMADFAIGDWRQRLQQNLPQARATVCRDHFADNRHWDCDHLSNSAIVIKIGWISRAPIGDSPRLVLATGL